MKSKNIINFIIVASLALSLIVLLFGVFKLNIIKHAEMQAEEYTLKFYGSFSEARKVKIYKDGDKLCSADVSIASDFFELGHTAYLEDLNFDGSKDLLIPHSSDLNSDPIYAAYILNDENVFVATAALSDISKPEINTEAKKLTSKLYLRETVEIEQEETVSLYEDSQILSIYELRDASFILVEKKIITYYIETDYYCYYHYVYNEDNQSLECVLEDWFGPDKLSDYNIK